jgi:hypothetical protein
MLDDDVAREERGRVAKLAPVERVVVLANQRITHGDLRAKRFDPAAV